jgi:GTPase SAR1 family protein
MIFFKGKNELTLLDNDKNFMRAIAKSIASDFYSLKFLLVGPTKSEKATLITNFSENHPIGMDFKIIELDICGLQKICVRDTLILDEHSMFWRSEFKGGADGILLVFNLEVLSTFETMESWLESCRKYAPQGAQILLVGTLIDPKSIVVNNDTITKFTEKHNINYVQVNVSNRSEIKNAYVTLGKQVIDQIIKNFLAIQVPYFDEEVTETPKSYSSM